ncbi:related to UPF0743 protein YCR087C-A [Hanseniaspora guilliermondii]|uniref:Related to UPF0743 protein YCR087C-A n=1 Tax=Hanseniaspora guilliermondii TaxID=56406 RepID=A0A1L0CRC8_9ASCO|nr:related to UPF0743 protein YCR087C-A [Hanseniaspora guilliermondii]
MVTFNCEVCNETVPKKQTEKHFYKCRDAYYTCIDCNKCFDDYDGLYKKHTQCISEDQKYMGKLYQDKNKKNNKKDTSSNQKEEKNTQKQESNHDLVRKEKKASKNEDDFVKDLLKPGDNLYKILKTLEKNKDAKLDKKQLLKKIVVNKDGKLTVDL